MNPAEALRLSRARTLAIKHGSTLETRDADGNEIGVYAFNLDQVAAMLDEATAAKDATIAALRKEISDAVREGERGAREAYEQGQADESDRHRDPY